MFVLSNRIKQSSPNCPFRPGIVPRYPLDIDICPYACLQEYINRTQVLRHDDTLFVCTIKPYRAVGLQTLSRWIKEVLQMTGIDYEQPFKPHSTRHATSTAAYRANVPLDEILKRAAWSNANTFEILSQACSYFNYCSTWLFRST